MSGLVSVIVPVYNIEDYLPRCLDCIEMQTYKDLEIILVDDGSTDGSGQLCDEFAAKDLRALVIHHPENRGLWAARNTGQDAAHGEYLWFPDGDDYFHKDIVKVMYETINNKVMVGSDQTFDMVIVNYGKTTHPDENTMFDFTTNFIVITPKELFDNMDNPYKKHIANTMWSKFFRRELVKDIRTRSYQYAQDRDFSIRVYLKEPNVAFINNELYWWVQRPSSAMQSANYPLIHSQCASRLYYNNFLMSISQKKKQYSRYLLYSLYYWMPMWVQFASGTDLERAVRHETKIMVRKTGLSYLRCRYIKTTKKRFFLLLKIRFSKLYGKYLSIK